MIKTIMQIKQKFAAFKDNWRELVGLKNLNDLIQFNVQHLVKLWLADSIPKSNKSLI